MVPQEWIEHSTSPLPRVRSTTELRRHEKQILSFLGEYVSANSICTAHEKRAPRLKTVPIGTERESVTKWAKNATHSS